jgi:transcriptional antiterminator NusG
MTHDETISDDRAESQEEALEPGQSSPDPDAVPSGGDATAPDAGENDAVSDVEAVSDTEEPSVVEGDEAEAPVGEVLNEFGFSAAEMVDEDEELYEDEGEDVSPIEEFVDESVTAGGDDVDMDWYILKVQVNRENSICDALRRRVKVAGMEHYFGDVLVPTEDVREFSKAGKQRIVKRKLYPGYIVVNMAINDDSWFLVRETSGIGDFTGAAGKPAPLSTEEISRIIATTNPPEEEEGEENIKTAIPFKVGDRVRVKEGYFQNHEGEVSDVDERNGRITVMINIFGRPNPVELDHWHVENV